MLNFILIIQRLHYEKIYFGYRGIFGIYLGNKLSADSVA
jgi:hypothetical protein